jgi:prepilin-type N-terminal cleavage/methylation domain-containing protein
MTKREAGFTLLEVLFAMAITAIFAGASLRYTDSVRNSAQLNRIFASRSRVLSGIRTLAGMPASLRNSVRAAGPSGGPLNPDLYNCTNGAVASACTTGKAVPFTLFSPLIQPLPSGVLATLPVTAPSGTTPIPAYARFDAFGLPCDDLQVDQCPIAVQTEFSAQCGPTPMPFPAPANPTSPVNYLAPRATCTIADVINVTYWIHLYSPYVAGGTGDDVISGPVTTPVVQISGNAPQ